MKKIIIILLLLSASLNVVAYNVRGDLNNDGKANITDVTFLINRLLSGETQWTYDVTGDGQVNISDVTTLINYLLSGDWPGPDYNGPAMPDNAVIYTVNGYQFVMVPVEGGTFMMGSEISGEDASPVHQVTLSSYSIGMTEVTFGLWKAVTGSYPPIYAAHVDTDDMPNWYCSYDQAKDFITQLNELTGLNFHLPSEAQWEFAARGGNLSHGYMYAGSNNLDEVGWFTGNSDPNELHSVGLKAPNELGLYDMSGNVKEFCEDDYMSYTSEPQVDPVLYGNNSTFKYRVLRGGGRGSAARECTVTIHKNNSYVVHGVEVVEAGLRLAL